MIGYVTLGTNDIHHALFAAPKALDIGPRASRGGMKPPLECLVSGRFMGGDVLKILDQPVHGDGPGVRIAGDKELLEHSEEGVELLRVPTFEG